ncbi:MAG: phosphate acyltransferase PlsX [Ruminococcaceae bacterium]|nr:phosphate acyltransferase PlsX [Oscillospiraceae bacterium]
MKIIVDAMSGDNAPVEIIKGAVQAHAELGVNIILVGDTDTVNRVMSENSLSYDGIEICHSEGVITMEDNPICVIKSKKESSMAKAFTLLRDGAGDAVVSAGNTGAILTGASLILKKIKGIKRAAIGTIIPLDNPMLLLDSGANTDNQPEYLQQFAVMGYIYMKNIFGLEAPRVGLINNGTEETKGTEAYVKAHELLKETEGINFIGNIEGRDIPSGVCDVIVADGFTGNIILKLCEGFGSYMSRTLKGIFKESVITKLGAFMVLPQVKALKKKLDHTEYGGAPLLGVSAPVIKAHGSSNAKAFKNAVKQAKIFAETGITQEIINAMAKK